MIFVEPVLRQLARAVSFFMPLMCSDMLRASRPLRWKIVMTTNEFVWHRDTLTEAKYFQTPKSFQTKFRANPMTFQTIQYIKNM